MNRCLTAACWFRRDSVALSTWGRASRSILERPSQRSCQGLNLLLLLLLGVCFPELLHFGLLLLNVLDEEVTKGLFEDSIRHLALHPLAELRVGDFAVVVLVALLPELLDGAYLHAFLLEEILELLLVEFVVAPLPVFSLVSLSEFFAHFIELEVGDVKSELGQTDRSVVRLV